jgi:4,5-dihydroxyphthalate decarboxylase
MDDLGMIQFMSMRKLSLSVAVGNYDRIRPLVDGEVLIDGVDPVFMHLEPEEIFFRAFRSIDFDVCELSLSSFAVKTANGDNPYVGVPVFPSRTFRHTAFYIRMDRGIRSATDLRGRRIGTPEYQLTASVWCRIILEEDHGVRPDEIRWVRGGIGQTGRIPEKIALSLPKNVSIEEVPADKTLSSMLDAGEIDGVIGPRAPLGFYRGDPRIGWLFPDPRAAAREFFQRTRIFPIMHVLGVRRTLVDQHPWLPFALFKAFSDAKERALVALSSTSTAKVTLPFVEESLREARSLMGEDFWSYGLEPNRHVLDTFLRHHHAQGLSGRRLAPEELFHRDTFETIKT